MRFVDNPPNPWLTQSIEWIGEPPRAKIEVFEETETRTIISRNDSPDVAFDYSINCYRGCIHGCTYCFSRPTHEYLDFGAGTDFERKIVVKVRAAELLRKELMKPSWKGDEIVGGRGHSGGHRDRADDPRINDGHSRIVGARERMRSDQGFSQHAASSGQRCSLLRTTAAGKTSHQS